MKAWHIFTGETCDDSSLLVFANTRGRASVLALNAGLWEYGGYINVKARRAKAYDGMMTHEFVADTNNEVKEGFPPFYADEDGPCL